MIPLTLWTCKVILPPRLAKRNSKFCSTRISRIAWSFSLISGCRIVLYRLCNQFRIVGRRLTTSTSQRRNLNWGRTKIQWDWYRDCRNYGRKHSLCYSPSSKPKINWTKSKMWHPQPRVLINLKLRIQILQVVCRLPQNPKLFQKLMT